MHDKMIFLPHDEVHVWLMPLDIACGEIRQLEWFLDAGERARAKAFFFDRDARRFISCHGRLRVVLGKYLGVDPSKVVFGKNPHGKPMVAGTMARCGLRFNISHSEGLAVCAIARWREVGVDLEFVRPVPDASRIARRHFSDDEYKEWRGLAPELAVETFFNCWTRKEAYAKARGLGLSIELRSFTVSLRPGSPGELRCDAGRPEQTGRWSMYPLWPGLGYAGALVVEGHSLKVVHRSLGGIESLAEMDDATAPAIGDLCS